MKIDVDLDDTPQLESQPFLPRGYRRIVVKVVDVYGDESSAVKDLR